MRFARRLLVVWLVALAIVGGGFALKQVDAINAYFQKGGPPDGQEGGHAGQTPKAGEDRAIPGDDNQPPKADEPTRDEEAPSAPGTATDPATESHDAADANKADDGAHEQWPALNFDNAGHALVWIAPVVAGVVLIDVNRRKRRKPVRLARAP